MRYFKQLLLIFALALSSFSQAQDIPEPPDKKDRKLVNDFANVLSTAESNALEQKLVQFFFNTGNAISVFTVESLNGYDAASFAYEIGEKWQVGKKEFDNGIVILFKPKTGNSRGQVFIATGYGLEGAIPDATTKEIVSNEMIPYFKLGQIYEGIDKASSVLMGLAKGEFNHQQYSKQRSQSGGGGFLGFLIPLFIILIFSFLGRSRSRGHRTMGSSSSSLPFWMLLGMMGSGSRSHGSSFSDFSSGSGGFGGGGSFGGFGGFGGGSFGGGGAGGSW
ncbi:TPM domain-containing protein [Ancylomarina sp. DW003]|nr:TPM domain-containing protein [Ancylomarina sp. DW003]MDE5423051.1 TPM domain-containing protein [Ancylomarina sp. DW003]